MQSDGQGCAGVACAEGGWGRVRARADHSRGGAKTAEGATGIWRGLIASSAAAG